MSEGIDWSKIPKCKEEGCNVRLAPGRVHCSFHGSLKSTNLIKGQRNLEEFMNAKD